MGRRMLAALALLLLPLLCAAQEGPLLAPDDHLNLVSVGTPRVSPDGRWIAYSVSRFDAERGKNDSDIYLIPFEGGEARRLTTHPGSESDYVWNPDSHRIAFAASRDGDSDQIYVIDIDGGEARRLTDMESDAYGPAWSPDGTMLAFYSDVGDLYTAEEREALGDVRYIRHLRYYHRRTWDDGARPRIFVMPAEGGEARRLTDGECADEGDHSLAWSPDSREIAYVSNRAGEWWNSIDTNVYVVDVVSGESRQVTTNPGPDHNPAFSPDGGSIAYLASYEYNYEAENYRIHVVPRGGGGGEPLVLTGSLDRHINAFAWGPGGERIYFTAGSEGDYNIRFVETAAPDLFHDVTAGHQVIRRWSLVDNDRFVMLRATDVEDNEIYTLVGGQLNRLTTDANAFYAGYQIQPCEEIWIEAEDGARMQGWLIKPVGYQEGRSYPLILSIHGGPQGMSTPTLRFEFQLLANRGYAVLFTNPRGSRGYGQLFTDQINQDWGGLCYRDLMRFVDHVVETGIADPEKLGVMGGSFGGYMTNWIIGHTDRFAAAVSVAGLSNLVSFFGTTDEQFFIEKDMGGLPWRNREVYLGNSPLWHADNFSTPTMVIHGQYDFRVRTEQGEQIFTALQKMGVPSSYVWFPNEGHGVRQPIHLALYYRLKLEWFDHWLRGIPVDLATYITPRPYRHPPEP